MLIQIKDNILLSEHYAFYITEIINSTLKTKPEFFTIKSHNYIKGCWQNSSHMSSVYVPEKWLLGRNDKSM